MHGLIHAKSETPPKRQKPGARVVFQNVAGGTLGEIALDRRRRRLSSLARRADARRPFIVSVHRPGDTLRPQDHTVRLRADWKKTTIAHDDIVLVTYLPRGGGGDAGGQSAGKSIGMAVAMLALAVAAPYAIAAIGPAALAMGTFANAAISAGLVLGGGYLLSLATRAKANTASDERPLYGVSGGGNLPRPGDRIPAYYGRSWWQPDLSQPDYTVYDGEDQILYKRLTLGLGKYQVHTLRLGDAVLWTAGGGVQAPFNAVPGGSGGGGPPQIGDSDTHSGLGTAVEIVAPGAVSELVPGSVYSSPNVVGIELPRASDIPSVAGPFLAAPLGLETKRIQLDYSLPQGAFRTRKKDGKDFSCGFGVLFEYAPCDEEGVATGGYSALHQYSGDILTKRAQRFTRYIDVAEGAYLVRARNVIDWEGDHINETSEAGVVNSVFWDGLRSHFAETIVRPHVTEIALRVRSGKGLGITAFADLWVEAERVLLVWNGAAWVEEPTRKAVYAFKDIMQAEYGGGLADAEFDLERIKFYAAGLSDNDTFDGVIRGPVSVWSAAATVLGPMRAEPARIGNTWSLNRDEPREARKHVFSRREIVRGSTTSEFKIARDDGATDVIVEYSPGGDPNKRRDVRVTFGAETVTPRRIGLGSAGITSHGHAHHIATWIAASAYYRRERRKIAVNRQGRIVGRGDPVRIDSWFMAEARAGGVLSRSSLALTLDTPMVVGGSSYALLRNRVAQEFGPIAVTADPDPAKTNVIHLDPDDLAVVEEFFEQTLDDTMAGDHQAMTSVLVGPLTELQDGYLIDAVMPQGREVIGIEAVNDAPEVWDALGEATPPAPPIPSAGDLLDPAIPEVPWVRAKCVQKAVALEMEWAVGRTRGAARYVVQLSYDDGANWETVSEDMSTSGSASLRHVIGVTVKVGAFAVSPKGVVGPAVYTEFTTFVPIATSDNIQVRLTAFETALRKLVTSEFKRTTDRIKEIEDDIARFTAELDVTKLLDKWRANGTLHETRTVLQSNIDGANASVEEVRQVAADVGEAFAAYSVTVNAKIGAPGANDGVIQATASENQQAFASHVNGAFATLNQTVAVNVWNPTGSGQLQASVTTQSVAIATMEGKLAAAWSVTLNVNGWITGVKLINDGSFGAFVVSADTFQVAFPGVQGPTSVFQIANVNGVARGAFRGEWFHDGVFTTRMLAAGSVKTITLDAGAVNSEKIAVNGVDLLNIIDGAVSGTAFSQGASGNFTCTKAGGQVKDLTSTSFDCRTGKLSIDVNVDMNSNGQASPWSYALRFEILVDNVVRRTAYISPLFFYHEGSGGYLNYHANVTSATVVVSGLSLGPHTILGRITVENRGQTADDPGGQNPDHQNISYREPALRVFEARR